MSITSGINEHSFQSHQIFATKNENDTKVNYERFLRYSQLAKYGQITRDYIRHSTKMNLWMDTLDRYDWYIILEEICNKEYPLRELQLRCGKHIDEPIEPDFTEFAKTIGTHSTLIKFECTLDSISSNTNGAVLFQELKNNRSIRYMQLNFNYCNFDTIHVFAETLMNNQILLSLDISFYQHPGCASRDDEDPPEPIGIETVVELARLLQTTAVQDLQIRLLDTESFKVLTESLPKTLLRLDIAWNEMNRDIIPTLRSYLKSNGSHLQELILSDTLVEEYLQEYQSSLSPALQIIGSSSWQAKFLRHEEPFCINLKDMPDSDWSESLIELIKDEKICQQMHLIFNSQFDRNQSNYVRTLLGQQSRLISLQITDVLFDSSIQLELFRQLKDNNSIIEFILYMQMELNVFDEFIKLLMNKNNIIRLDLSYNSYISDDEAILLAKVLKNNTVLQRFSMDDSHIGDIGFQALLASVPDSLTQLIVDKSRISAKSLPSLLAFIQARPYLKYFSLRTNGISSTAIDINVPDLIDQIFQITYANHCICHLDINEKVKEAMAKATSGEINLLATDLRDDHVLELFNEINKQPSRHWSLNLGYNDEISAVGYRYLADILSSTIPIVELSVARNYMNEEARTTLLNGLCKNKTLKKFIVFSNKLNNQDMESIGCFIQNNPMLKEINLYQCEIDSDGLISLAKVLPESTLEELDLRENSIDDSGCASILSSIPPTLTTLSLNGNQITESSLQTILTFLAANRTLKNLSIGSNPIFEDMTYQQQLKQAAEQNNICELT